MRLLLDTNRYSQLVANDAAVTQRLNSATAVYFSVITLGELHQGFQMGTKRRRNEQRLREALTLQGVQVLFLDAETAEYFGRTAAALRRAGTPIPTNDVWIAAQALQHNLALDTRDTHFDRVRGLKRIKP
ncbi:MAG: type II toxin-antitoxin system VapC family toxin [Planctomycetota bacterium]